jgi:hypothetical protein
VSFPVRPDGYIGWRGFEPGDAGLGTYLKKVMA